MNNISCFTAYDIRGEIGVNIDEKIVYRIGRSIAQHFKAKSVVIGFDARETSFDYAHAASMGVIDAGADVLNIGLAGTEEMYWAVTEFNACAGIEITASHNPINFNGMKIVKSESQPLDQVEDFEAIKVLAELESWSCKTKIGKIFDQKIIARRSYVQRVLSFVDFSILKPLKIVVNSGNGAAGPTFDQIAKCFKEQGVPLKFVCVNQVPDHTFPNGIPNPLIPENQLATAEIVKKVGADFGVAFDGDFDRCFFFDEAGVFVPGEYIVGLLAAIFLEKEKGSTIVHDPRVIWNTQDIVRKKGGKSVQSKTGHAFIKKTMRDLQAVYGGEMSAHHYFRDFAYCDSGMIPWVLIAELVSKTGCSLGELVKDRFDKFPSSGELNYKVENADSSIANVLKAYKEKALSLDEIDGISLSFKDWRFNLRKSNTEPLVRLNLESHGHADTLSERAEEIAHQLGGKRI